MDRFVDALEKVAAPAAAFFTPRTLTAALAAAGVLAGALAPTPVAAQETAGQIRVDSIGVEGLNRIEREAVLSRIGFEAGSVVGLNEVRAAVKSLWASGDFADIRVRALGEAGSNATVIFEVDERPLIRRVRIEGLERIDGDEVQDSTGLYNAEPFSPAVVADAKSMIRTLLAEEGVPFATVQDRVEEVEGQGGSIVDVILEVDEGARVAVADVVVRGNEVVPTSEIVGAMATSPEGFWWWRSGSYDQDTYENDLGQRIPDLYRSRGYLDARILADTLVLDPETGKARLELEVEEGPQYRIARFTIDGNDVFDDERLETFFAREEGGLLQTLGLGGGGDEDVEQRGQVFDQVAFQAAVQEIGQLYRNQGYLFAQVQPSVVKQEPEEPGDPHTVSVGIQVREGNPAYINRVAVEGNDFTHEWVIRDKILVLPGDVYSENRIIQSYQNIQSLGFFETPMPLPDIQTDPESGEVDVTFRVVEQQTGAVNFGTSVGGGVGLSGFIGYDQPNLFGQAKEGHLRWDFGRFLNNFTVSFSDPALFRSRVSGSISLFDSRDRFFQFQSGQRNRLGMSLRFGFPISGWRQTRLFTGYSISRTTYEAFEGVDDTSVFGLPPGTLSQFSLGLTRSTLNHPLFPTSGSRQNVTLEANGGILGGDGDFQKLNAEGVFRVPIGALGGGQGGPGGVQFSMGLAVRTGLVFGDASDFPFSRFWMGGVNFGEQLRGYDETSVTPAGFFPENSTGISDIDRLGDAFLSVTADYSLRLSSNVQFSTFLDAGNVWTSADQIDPTRLFRGAGFGIQLVTPFGPLGLDYAYGFDKTVPGWQFHFRMGPGF